MGEGNRDQEKKSIISNLNCKFFIFVLVLYFVSVCLVLLFHISEYHIFNFRYDLKVVKNLLF